MRTNKMDIEKILKNIELKKNVKPIISIGKDLGKMLAEKNKKISSGGKK